MEKNILSVGPNFQGSCHIPISKVTAGVLPRTAKWKTPAVTSLIGVWPKLHLAGKFERSESRAAADFCPVWFECWFSLNLCLSICISLLCLNMHGDGVQVSNTDSQNVVTRAHSHAMQITCWRKYVFTIKGPRTLGWSEHAMLHEKDG